MKAAIWDLGHLNESCTENLFTERCNKSMTVCNKNKKCYLEKYLKTKKKVEKPCLTGPYDLGKIFLRKTE